MNHDTVHAGLEYPRTLDATGENSEGLTHASERASVVDTPDTRPKVFARHHVMIAAFFGSVLGSALLIARNLQTVQPDNPKRTAMSLWLVAVGIQSAIYFLVFMLPPAFKAILGVCTVFIGGGLYTMYGGDSLDQKISGGTVAKQSLGFVFFSVVLAMALMITAVITVSFFFGVMATALGV
jgi:hypothetical protein